MEEVSISPEDSLLGLPNLTVLSTEATDSLQVWAAPKERPDSRYCGFKGVRIKATYWRTVKLPDGVTE